MAKKLHYVGGIDIFTRNTIWTDGLDIIRKLQPTSIERFTWFGRIKEREGVVLLGSGTINTDVNKHM